MNSSSLRDSVQFYALVSTGSFALAAALLALNLNAPSNNDPYGRPWFFVGIVALALAVASFFVAVVLAAAHNHQHPERPAAPEKPARTARPRQPRPKPPMEPAPTEVPQARPPRERTARPIDVDVDPEHLWSFFEEGHTELDGQRGVEPFIGKWLTVRGNFGNVSGIGGDSAMVTFLMNTYRKDRIIHMFFKGATTVARVATLPIGKRIVVRGRIKSVSGINMVLEDCELLPDNPEPRPTLALGA